MISYKRNFYAITFLIGFLLSSSAFAEETTQKATENIPRANDLESQISETNAQIESAISHGVCHSDDDCSILPVGQKACGGPSSYVAYSTQNPPPALVELKQLSAKSQSLARKANELSGIKSNCEYEAEPEAYCSQSRCKIVEVDENGQPNR